MNLPLSRVIAHRGDRAHAPENTRAAIKQAALKGAKWVEFDATLCADTHKPVVIFHDDNIFRTTNGGSRLITDVGFEELRLLDAGDWFDTDFRGEQVPTLMEVLDDCAELGLYANVEIKISENGQTDMPEPFDFQLARLTAERVLQDIERGSAERKARSINLQARERPDDNLLISSFSSEALRVVRAQRPDLPRGYLLHRMWPDEGEFRRRLRETDPATLNLNHELLESAQSVNYFRKVMEDELGRILPVLCYTVNDPIRAKTLVEWGVTGVFADDPAAMQAALK